jgi:CO dehydrogenase/acetyl-CoA synthase delta subunit
MPAEPIAVTLLVADALEALDVPCAIGGSNEEEN